MASGVPAVGGDLGGVGVGARDGTGDRDGDRDRLTRCQCTQVTGERLPGWRVAHAVGGHRDDGQRVGDDVVSGLRTMGLLSAARETPSTIS